MHKLRLASILLLSLSFLSACAEVRPWQRGNFAKVEMQWQTDALESALNDHIFFSKEASSGGNNAAGGGCGCN